MRVADEILIAPSAEAALRELRASKAPEAKAILRRVDKTTRALRQDPLLGEVVRRRFVPRRLAATYEFDSLFVVDLPGYWRLLYSITRTPQAVSLAILEIVDHRTYDRWFQGRGR